MDDEILKEFLAESWENLARLDHEIVELEKRPSDRQLLASIFRTIHTIKGTCGFIGLTELGSVAHAGENVLGKLRDGTLSVSGPIINTVLEAIDEIKFLLNGLESTGTEPKRNNTGLIRRLNEFADGKPGDAAAADTADQPAESADATTTIDPAPHVEHSAPAVSAASDRTAATSVPAVTKAAAPVVTSPSFTTPAEAVAASAHAAEGLSSGPAPRREQSGEATMTVGTAVESQPESEPDRDRNGETGNGESAKKSIADLSIRVDVDVVDRLMNMVGELVLTRNQLLQMVRGDEESRYSGPISHLNRVTTDLQEAVMKTRMQPIGNAWSKLPRLVRDLSRQMNKQIELEMTGAETELDRTVLDAIKDPLTHMVRNSGDHGIEMPAVRRAAGKPERGTIRLQAYHEGGHVIICIQDDGAGIAAQKVKQKAIQSGLITERDAARMSDKEILALIFQPGLSTAEKITSVSGRGVGMDVVKTQIERIGGIVDLSSVAGQGTTIRIKIPLTLAIISALVVESGGQPFAIPQLGIVELVRLAAEDRSRIERVHDQEVFRLRKRLLPLVYLDQVLGLSDRRRAQTDINIVVVQVGDEQFGLIVDEVFDTEEIVVKPMGQLLKAINIYQGTTILGDGQVIMILDVAGIAASFGGLGGQSSDRDAHRSEDDDESGTTSLLLFESRPGVTMAVPLSLVSRLEEFPRKLIERTGDRMVVQYRGALLPLLPLEGSSSQSDVDPQPVIVFSEGPHSMGLLVNQIQDIFDERLIIRMQSTRPGVLGTAIINGRATDLIDTNYYVMKANPEWFQKKPEQSSRRVLVVDDSIFFRQLVTTALESEGYRVRAADGGKIALKLLDQGEKFDLIVSDLEMPEMTGWDLAKAIRERGLTQLPLLALSSLTGGNQDARAKRAGFNRFQQKFNVESFLRGVEELTQAEDSTVHEVSA